MLKAFKEGVEGFNGNLINYGLLSTPQLHFMVYNLNKKTNQAEEDAYFNKLATAFNNLMSLYNNKVFKRLF